MPINAGVPTTVEEWAALREAVKQSVIFRGTSAQRLDFGICTGLTCVSGVLYIASFLKRRKTGTWVIKRDNEGYWHPNVHTALPIFAVLFIICNVTAVVYLENEFGKAISPVSLALQLVSYQILQAFASLKIWAILYALPPSHLHSPTASISLVKGKRRLFSPMIFNIFTCGMFAAALVAQVPIIVLLLIAITKIRSQLASTDHLFGSVLEASATDDSAAIYEAALATFLRLAQLKKEGLIAQRIFRVYTIYTSFWLSANFLAFSISTAVLLGALAAQINFLKSSLQNQKALNDIQETHTEPFDNRHSFTSWILESHPSSPTSRDYQRASVHYEQDHNSPKSVEASFNPWKWRSWMDFAQDDSINGNTLWETSKKTGMSYGPVSPLSSDGFSARNCPAPNPEILIIGLNSELGKHCANLTRYWYSTLGQSILAVSIIASFLVLNISLIRNTSKLSLQDQMIFALRWSGWTWGGGPGVLLGIVACVVAFSPTPSIASSATKLIPDHSEANSREIKTPKAIHPAPKPARKVWATAELISHPIQKVPFDGAYRGYRMSHQREDSELSSALMRRPGSDSSTLNYQTDMVRNDSINSTYSSQSYKTANQDSAFANSYTYPQQLPHDQNDWNIEDDELQKEDLQAEECSSGHFQAIHSLRNGNARYV